ncbi:hypothetical protein DINM_004416 [Dirofilaria immitis]|nr:hypothetical protein [Dirofilaria immitis]
MLLPSWRAWPGKYDNAKMRRRGRLVGKGWKEADRQNSNHNHISPSINDNRSTPPRRVGCHRKKSARDTITGTDRAESSSCHPVTSDGEENVHTTCFTPSSETYRRRLQRNQQQIYTATATIMSTCHPTNFLHI